MLTINTSIIILLVIILGLSIACIWYQNMICSKCDDDTDTTTLGMNSSSWKIFLYVIMMIILVSVTIVLVNNKQA
jgi:hypothetical protein